MRHTQGGMDQVWVASTSAREGACSNKRVWAGRQTRNWSKKQKCKLVAAQAKRAASQVNGQMAWWAAKGAASQVNGQRIDGVVWAANGVVWADGVAWWADYAVVLRSPHIRHQQCFVWTLHIGGCAIKQHLSQPALQAGGKGGGRRGERQLLST